VYKNPAVNINDINNQNTKLATKPTFIYVLIYDSFFLSPLMKDTACTQPIMDSLTNIPYFKMYFLQFKLKIKKLK
jgi:hypothetical protein